MFSFFQFVCVLQSNIKNLQLFLIVEPEYCEKLSPDSSCPKSGVVSKVESAQQLRMEQEAVQADLNDYLRRMLNEAIGMMDLIISMGLTGVTVLIFTLGYYCINKARKEGPLINKVSFFTKNFIMKSYYLHFRSMY